MGGIDALVREEGVGPLASGWDRGPSEEGGL